MAELYKANWRNEIKPIPVKHLSTEQVCSLVESSNEDLELVDLRDGRYLAFARSGFVRQLHVNERATSLLNKALPGPLKVYGPALVFSAKEL